MTRQIAASLFLLLLLLPLLNTSCADRAAEPPRNAVPDRATSDRSMLLDLRNKEPVDRSPPDLRRDNADIASVHGCVWEPMSSTPPTELLVDVQAAPNGTYYAVGAWIGAIYASTDRANWTVVFPGTTAKLGLAAISAQGTPVAVGAFPTQISPYQVDFQPALFVKQGNGWNDQAAAIALAVGNTVLRDVWRSPTGKLYVATWDGVFKENGNVWSQVAAPPKDHKVHALWGISDDNIIALVGPQASLQLPHLALRYNGITWKSEIIGKYPTLTAIHGSAANNIVVVGGDHACGAINKGALVRFDGAQWQKQLDLTEDPLGVWTANTADTWIVGYDPCSGTKGIILHYDGIVAHKDLVPNITTSVFGATSQDLVVTSEKMIYWRRCL